MDNAQYSQAGHSEAEGIERLSLRISAMINSPQAQLRRAALIHRLDTDTDLAWDSVLEMLSETAGLEMTFQDDGNVLLAWSAPSENDALIDDEDMAVAAPAAPF